MAIRAVFKAVQEGKVKVQAFPRSRRRSCSGAALENVCASRYAAYPVRVSDCLELPQTAKASRATIKARRRIIDVVIGTHRILSKDVKFSRPRLGRRRRRATFPRKAEGKIYNFSGWSISNGFRHADPAHTLPLLTGARDMSTIETAPPNRHPVETIVAPYDERVIRDAIQRELARNGQVYFLHNRIHSIHEVAQHRKAARPEACADRRRPRPDGFGRTRGRHGSLRLAGETDILLSTTIIESGLEQP